MRVFQLNQGPSGNLPQPVGTPVQTDAQGQFIIQPGPVGVFKLMADGGTAANGTYDMQFKLFDGSGNQIGSTITNPSVLVSNGVFTVQLDYGAAAFP
jgi:hypothetical protein